MSTAERSKVKMRQREHEARRYARAWLKNARDALAEAEKLHASATVAVQKERLAEVRKDLIYLGYALEQIRRGSETYR